jgi:3-ketoacyl-CoA synthase
MINWTHVVGTHAPHIMVFGIVLLLAQITHQVVTTLSKNVEHTASPGELNFSLETISAVALEIKEIFVNIFQSVFENHGLNMLSPAVKTTAVILFVCAWLIRRDNPIYLLSFATFKAPDSWKCSHEDIVEMMRCQGCFTEESLQFMERILARSGTGQATAWPPGITQCLKTKEKADRSMDASREEAETVLFDICGEAMRKANVKPKEIDILVINCSLFSPTPSLCAMVASHFGMRSDIATYNLSGMGCSASLISIDLAKKLLQHGKGGKALVVSTEIITPNLYHGNDRGFLIQNTLFRCGGAAMVLSNSWLDGRRAWYKLLHTVRVQGTGPESYNCVYETEDDDGERGVRLSKDIVKVAGKCMEKNMTMLGPLVLPLTEQAKVVVSIATRFLLKATGRTLKSYGRDDLALKLPNVRPYVPDFKRGIDHFCIHAGGRAVIDGIEKNMKLEEFHTEPSRMALMNYGNTSSSSIWYELEYIHEHQRSNPIKKGDRIMQVAFGSGFKCTSGVWLKL